MPPGLPQTHDRDIWVGFRKENPDGHISEPILSDRKAQADRGLDAPVSQRWPSFPPPSLLH